MDAKTLTALEASIEHWEDNASLPPDQAEISGTHCALCSCAGLRCDRCPADNNGYCCSGAWSAAYKARESNSTNWSDAAQAVVDVLKGLRK